MVLACQQRGLTLDENDLWVAATALALGATLASRERVSEVLAACRWLRWSSRQARLRKANCRDADAAALLSIGSLARVPRSLGGNGFDDHVLQHFLVHIGQFLDVEAALAGRVLAELGEQRLGIATAGRAI